MRYFIAINGPARSGKDTLTKFVKQDDWFRKHFTVHHVAFAQVIKDCVHRFIGEKYSDERKHEVMELSTIGKTYRDSYIAFSEDFAKPIFGPDIFGRLVARSIIEQYTPEWGLPRLFVCSDSGFKPEYEAVQHELGADNTMVVKLFREGFDFPGDSRSYWSTGMQSADIYNNASTEEFKLNGVSVLRDLVIARKWHVNSELEGTKD